MITPNRAEYGLGIGRIHFGCGTFYGHNGLVSGTQSTAAVSADGSDGAVIAVNLASWRDPALPRLADEMLCSD